MLDNFEDHQEFDGDDIKWNTFHFIYGMRHASRTMMMDCVYSAILENSTLVLKSETSKKRKIDAINHILKFFEDIEQYEKCAELKKIIDKIKS